MARWIVLVCALAFAVENSKALVLVADDGCFEPADTGDSVDPCPDECPLCSCCGHLVSSAVPMPSVIAVLAPSDHALMMDAQQLMSRPPHDILHVPKAC